MKLSGFSRAFIGFIGSVRPRRLAPYVALAGVAGAFRYAISEEVPVGSIRGQALMEQSNGPLEGATLSLTPISTEGDEDHVRRARTDQNGRFTLAQVPAGSYYLSGYASAHQVQSAFVTVDEGAVSSPVLTFSRSESDLSLGQHQRVFSLSEGVRLPVRGYVRAQASRHRDSVHIRLYRTKLSNLVRGKGLEEGLRGLGVRYGSQGDREPLPLPAELLHPTAGPAPVLALDRDFPITEADKEGFYFQRFGFGALTAGLYLTQVDHDRKSASTWLLVTDTSLVIKRADRQMIAYAANIKTGSPLPGTEVEIFRDGKLEARKRTGGDGTCELSLPSEHENQDEGRTMAIGVRGDDEALVERSNYYGSEENGQFAVAAYTDRPIYRPGHRISFKGIARRAVERGIRYTIPTGEPIRIEVLDPKGDSVFKERLVANRFGSFFGRFDLSPEAVTGVYTLAMTVSGEKHTHGIVVASYQKPEFEASVVPDKKIYVRGDSVEMKVTAKYYFGAPVAGATAHYYVDRSTDWSAEFPDDYELDPSEDYEAHRYYARERFRGESGREGDIRLDENGSATIRIPADFPDLPNSPQQHILRVSVTVKDESNREVSSDGEAKVAAGDYRLSVKPDGYLAAPRTPMGVTVRVTDLGGAAITGARVELEESFTRWKDGKYSRRVFHKDSITSGADGRAIATVVPPNGGSIEIKARVVDSKGRSIRGRADVWAASDDGGDLDTEYADLSLATDKRRYAPGETARVLINADRTGQSALVTVEGDRVYRALTVPLLKKSTVVRIPVLAEYGPNVTLAACYVKEKGFARSETPLRVTVASRDINLSVWADPPSSQTAARKALSSTSHPGAEPGKQIEATAKSAELLPRFHPRDTVTYHVKATDSSGKPAACEFSLGVVDESIYALAEDDPQLLQEAFYPRRSNNVTTEFSFAVDFLGDADKAEPKIVSRKEFPDTVFWAPALTTGADGSALVTVPLKDNLTTWRATVLAHTPATAVGRSTCKIISTKELFVRVEAPRFLTSRDQSEIAAIVHNETGADQTALLRFRPGGISTDDPTNRTLQIKAGGIEKVTWRVTAGESQRATVDVSAWTPREAGITQYTDRIETSLPIRPHGREEVTTFSGEVTDRPTGETIRLDPSAIPSATRVTVRITPSVLTSLGGALDYLVGYPYGCTEQTMSRFLPDLMVQRLLRTRSNFSVQQKAELPVMVRDGLARLARFQHEPSGSWGWWEHDSDDAWMTAYVLYGLGVAKREGYVVNPRMLKKGLAGATQLLAKTASDDEKAFLLYGMAFAGGPPEKATASIVRANLNPARLSSASLAYIVLLDQLLGRDPRPALLDLNRRSVVTESGLKWGRPTGLGSSHFDWDERMVTALALKAMLSVSHDDPRMNDVLRWLMRSRTGEYWEDTRATCWVLAALCDYLALPTASSAAGTVALSVNGSVIRRVDLGAEPQSDHDIVFTVPAVTLVRAKNDLTIERTGGSSTVFYSIEVRQTLATENLAAYSPSKITVKREYLRRTARKAGSDYWTLQSEPTNNRLAQGDRILVRLTLDVPDEAAYVLIEDPFPSGCEPSERGSADDVADWSYWWSSIDVRDDRIAFFARNLTKGEHVIEYNLRAQTPGEYHTLPTMLQAMYDPAIRAYSPESRIVIK